MKSNDSDPWLTFLAGSKSDGSQITVRDYSAMHRNRDRSKIADMIRRRFVERFLDPILDNPNRHGFAMVAVCCLMVETLESFRNGWNTTVGKVEGAFCGFFQAHDEFKELRPVAREFYSAVRCGILHQAETRQGWRIHRQPAFFVKEGGVKWLSASEFGKRLETVLNRYHDNLVNADWDATIWLNARKKLQNICRNCGLPEPDVAKLA